MINVAGRLGSGFSTVAFGLRLYDRLNSMVRDFTISSVGMQREVLRDWELENTDKVRFHFRVADREVRERTTVVVDELNLLCVLELPRLAFLRLGA